MIIAKNSSYSIKSNPMMFVASGTRQKREHHAIKSNRICRTKTNGMMDLYGLVSVSQYLRATHYSIHSTRLPTPLYPFAQQKYLSPLKILPNTIKYLMEDTVEQIDDEICFYSDGFVFLSRGA
eukprot:938362_1